MFRRARREPEVIAVGSAAVEAPSVAPNAPSAHRVAQRVALPIRSAEDEIWGSDKDSDQEEMSAEAEMDVDEKPIRAEPTRDYWAASESESEEEEDARVLMKPVFVKKAERQTLAELERIVQEEEVAAEAAARREAERAVEAKRHLAELLQSELDAAQQEDAEVDNGPPDTDGVDEEEFEKWKVREMKRIKRDREEQEAYEAEKREIERRRNMTDAEREEEDRKAGKFDEKPKAKWNFMQRYYHKGAFYMNDEAIRTKGDEVADAPTLEDRVDRSAMPKVLQVKKFGRPSQTKWTHLVAEDTSDRNSLWYNPEGGRGRGRGAPMQRPLTGASNVFDRPGKRTTRL